MTTVPITLTVNGAKVSAQVEPRTHLADFLRETLLLTGTHLGCEHGICGACTVMIDGAPARSCITLAVQADGAEVVTVEGFGDDPLIAKLRDAFTAHHALQCGYCTPGMLISAYDVAKRMPDADEAAVRHAMSGNLCRCTGYVGIVAATREAAAAVASGDVIAPAKPVARKDWMPPALAAPVVAAPAAAASPATVADAPVTLGADAVTLSESFVVPFAPAQVWDLLADPAKVVGCIPGAHLLETDGRSVTGEMTVKLGPISARFAGKGMIDRDPATMTGVITGRGADGGSRVEGRAVYRVAGEGDGTRVTLDVAYAITGPLAQVGRSGIARDVAGRLVGLFAANLSATLAGAPASSTAAVDPLSLLWKAIVARVRALLGR